LGLRSALDANATGANHDHRRYRFILKNYLFGWRVSRLPFVSSSGGMVFFIDGDKACTPMAVPDQLLAMMDDVAAAKISHEGSAL
jgi:hypothetical protein